MSVVGGAVGPFAMGLVFQATHSMAMAMIVPMLCYVFVTYYAYYGSRVRVPELNAISA
jgi:FHS family L-fucose permease-like MFS transporter